MQSAGPHQSRVSGVRCTTTLMGVLGAMGVLGVMAIAMMACSIDSPRIEANALPTSTVPLPTIAPPAFQPTTTATPSPTLIPTVAPSPSPVVAPSGTALEALTPTGDLEPMIVAAGPVTIPVGGTTWFELDKDRPVLQLPGHTLIYVDTALEAEVDIFTPVADSDGAPLLGYEAVLAEFRSNPIFAGLDEVEQITIGGLPTSVFEGRAQLEDRGFHSDLSTVGNDFAGWFPPIVVRVWLIDAPAGPIAVTAESLVTPGQYDEALALAARVLATISFG